MTDEPIPLPRILVVEDNPVNQLVISAMLRGHAELEIASDGRDALEILAARDFDGALIDIRMPVMDGETMMAHWREIERAEGRPRLAAAACTSNVQPGEVRRMEAAGFDRHISKPVMLPELRALIAWMGDPAREAAGAPADA